MSEKSDILIVGGGLNGPALALALAQTGRSVTILDAQSRPALENAAFDGRSYALALASKRLLQAIGVWDDLADQSQPMLDIKVSDGRAGEGAGPFFLHFDHREIEEGPMGFMVEDRYLRRVLLAAIDRQPLITQRYDSRVDAQTTSGAGVSITLSDGAMLHARMLIGADGRSSGTAKRAGIRRTGWEYGQTALVACVAHERPHNGVAHQFFMPPGPLAILPLPGNRSSIVWSETDTRAKEIHALNDADYLDVLRPRFGDYLGDISLEGARFTYPLNLTLANSFIGDRLALVGDAAHGMHPIAGQGLNAGLRDVGALAEVIADAVSRGEDFANPLVLKRYEQWRRFDTTTLAVATDSFNKLFSNDNPILRAGRDLGMGLVNAMPSLRRTFIREAAGLTGDLPKLLKGQSL